ncbi:MAG TPA: hypothetical protein VFT22_16450 [Kofleriaceae bacterium]|nr:hypothetical protein [Kofleriaceae bacterium]
MLTAAAACGGARTSDSTAPFETGRPIQRHEVGHMGDKEHMGKGEQGEMAEMEAMPPELRKFHETLAPRWHAPHGPKRMADTCAAMPQLHSDADAIAAASPPSGATADWAGNAKQLVAAVAALDAPCKASDEAAFEQAFMAVHDRFHGLMAASGHGHDEHHGEPGDPAEPSSHKDPAHDHGEH